jgi:hypothetical protein
MLTGRVVRVTPPDDTEAAILKMYKDGPDDPYDCRVPSPEAGVDLAAPYGRDEAGRPRGPAKVSEPFANSAPAGPPPLAAWRLARRACLAGTGRHLYGVARPWRGGHHTGRRLWHLRQALSGLAKVVTFSWRLGRAWWRPADPCPRGYEATAVGRWSGWKG